MDFIVKNLLIPMFFAIDNIVYGLIQDVYNLFFEIANISILSDTSIATFARRIYIIIGIFMLFKVAFSLITMLVNPESLTDSKKGGPALIKKIIIALVLLVAVPNIFTIGYRLQSIILNKNVLANLILGASSAVENTDDGSGRTMSDYYSDGGEIISVQVFKGFFHPKQETMEKLKSLEECKGASKDDEACIYTNAETVADFDDIIKSDDYVYNFLISTIAGAYVAWMLFMFCFDIAVRSVKLSFLQLIAPVPILASIDESQGNKVFKAWTKNCVSTFLSVFVRLITIYFIIFIISEIVKNGLIGYYKFDFASSKFVFQSGGSNFLLSAMIILGLLLFAKEVPKLIEEILGIKSSGLMSLNPFKHNAFLGGAVGGAVGATVGGIAAAQTARDLGKNKWAAGLRGLQGATTGTFRGAMGAGMKATTLKDAINKGSDAGAETSRRLEEIEGTSGIFGRTLARTQDKIHMSTAGSRAKKKIETYGNFTKSAKTLKDKAKAEALKDSKAQIEYKYTNAKGVEDTATNSRYALEAEIEKAKRKGDAEALTEYSQQLVGWEKTKTNKVVKEWSESYQKGHYTKIENAEALEAFSKMEEEVSKNPSYFAEAGAEFKDGTWLDKPLDASKTVASASAAFANDPKTKEAINTADYAHSANANEHAQHKGGK